MNEMSGGRVAGANSFLKRDNAPIPVFVTEILSTSWIRPDLIVLATAACVCLILWMIGSLASVEPYTSDIVALALTAISTWLIIRHIDPPHYRCHGRAKDSFAKQGVHSDQCVNSVLSESGTLDHQGSAS